MSSDSELLQLVADSRLTGYLAVAALCVLIYDHAACIPEEVELMWKSRWGVAKILYLWNRYFSLVIVSLNTSVILQDISSSNSCIGWLQVQGSSSTVLITTVDFVLALRVWILYGRPRWMVFFFAFLQISEVVVMIVVDVFTFRQMRDYIHLGTLVKGCYVYNVPRFLTLYAAGPLIVVRALHRFMLSCLATNQTLIMFLMTLYKCGLTLYRMDHRAMPIWKLSLRDGVVWFVLVFAAGGTEVLIWASGRQTLKQLLVVPALVVYSGVSSRTLLNIKKIMASDPAEIPETREISPITFFAP